VLIPLAGPRYEPGHKILLIVENRSCASVELTATLWGRSHPIASEGSGGPGAVDNGRAVQRILRRNTILRERVLENVEKMHERMIGRRPDIAAERDHADRADLEATLARRRELRAPLDEADDAAWESPADEWP
jgi:hypothetical protein